MKLSLASTASYLALGMILLSSADGQLTSCGSPSSGPVLNGVDGVATYNLAKSSQAGSQPPIMGTSDNAFKDAEGFEFYFSSAENAALYKKNPENYPVGAGGYCGLAVSGNDPMCSASVCEGPACLTSDSTYEMANGKLFFFLGSGAMRIFNSNNATASAISCDANIAQAESTIGGTCWNTDKFNCHGPRR